MTRIFLFSVLLAIALNARSNTYVIQNVNLVPMTEEIVLEKHSVLVSDGKVPRSTCLMVVRTATLKCLKIPTSSTS